MRTLWLIPESHTLGGGLVDTLYPLLHPVYQCICCITKSKEPTFLERRTVNGLGNSRAKENLMTSCCTITPDVSSELVVNPSLHLARWR